MAQTQIHDAPAGMFSTVPLIAVARVLSRMGREIELFARTIRHKSGLLGCEALVLDGDFNHPLGRDGATTWRQVLRNTMDDRRGGTFLGEPQKINFTEENEFIDAAQNAYIDLVTERVATQYQARQMHAITNRPAQRPTAPGGRRL